MIGTSNIINSQFVNRRRCWRRFYGRTSFRSRRLLDVVDDGREKIYLRNKNIFSRKISHEYSTQIFKKFYD